MQAKIQVMTVICRIFVFPDIIQQSFSTCASHFPCGTMNLYFR